LRILDFKGPKLNFFQAELGEIRGKIAKNQSLERGQIKSKLKKFNTKDLLAKDA
jgi:hypothetical protein